MAKPKTPRRIRVPKETPPPPLLQAMPSRRVRLDPTTIRDLAAFLLSLAEPWDRGTRLTLRGLRGISRDRTRAYRKWCGTAVGLTLLLVDRLTEQVSIDLIDRHRASFDGTAPVVPPGQLGRVPDWLITPPIPGTT